MMVHDSVDTADRVSLSSAHAARPLRSPARLLAEAIWFALWHSGAALAAGGRWLLLAERVRRERQALARMGRAQLLDIGVCRRDARAEAARAFTDLPTERRLH